MLLMVVDCITTIKWRGLFLGQSGKVSNIHKGWVVEMQPIQTVSSAENKQTWGLNFLEK
jgi:hypothetical protein